MATIIVTTLGTLGDLHPMIPIAHELKRRGHTLRFIVPPNLQARIVNEGFESAAVSMMPNPPAEAWRQGLGAVAAKGRVDKYYTPFLKSAIAALTRACEGADVLLSTPHQIGTAVAAERLHIPWVTLTVFPGLIPSSYTVPEPHWLPPLPTPAGRVVNRLTWSVFRFGLRYLAQDAIAEAVDSYGLRHNRDLFAPGALSPYLCLVLSSPAYSPRQRDWPPQVKVTGFTTWDAPRGSIDPEGLQQFIDSGPPPVVVTTSTADERNAPAYLTVARHALEKTGRRGILLAGHAAKALLGSDSHRVLPSGIAAWQYIPLSRVLPHASMVVHHSGIGTAAAVLRHGLPSVAIPASFDQWYNAGRIRSLGVGKVLKYDDLTIDRLAAAIDQVANKPSYTAHARELADQIRAEDGTATACNEIEALLARQTTMARC